MVKVTLFHASAPHLVYVHEEEKRSGYLLKPSPWPRIRVRSMTSLASAEDSSMPIAYVFRWPAGPTEGADLSTV